MVSDVVALICNSIADILSRDVPNESETSIIATMTSGERDGHIPPRQYRAISAVHNSLAGHDGVDKTLEKLRRQNVSWEHMRAHVRTFIKHCPCCQKMRAIAPGIISRPYTLARYEPMERLNIDTIGPLPVDESGNKFIIVIIDCFTRFIELYPAPDTTARLQ